jgi:hypothetical protein
VERCEGCSVRAAPRSVEALSYQLCCKERTLWGYAAGVTPARQRP